MTKPAEQLVWNLGSFDLNGWWYGEIGDGITKMT